MQTIVRFPPSPTGFLHIGNARVALINWLFAKKMGGKILLRFDDTDSERCKDEFKVQMEQDLAWLGLSFDEKFEQSKREEIYKDIFGKLKDAGFIYPCFETEEELELKRKVSLAKGKPPIYKKAEFASGQMQNPPYYRFKLENSQIKWNDLIQGEISYEGKDLSDPVILRANGNFMYTFCSIVDDFLTNVSHIIRGADHITNTAIQIQIFNALNLILNEKKQINFAHLPLFQGKEGKISKRVGGFSIMEIKKNGFKAQTINNVLAKIGLSYYSDEVQTMEDLVEKFDISNFNKAQITFDFSLLELFNQKVIAQTSYKEAKSELPINMEESFFIKIRENLHFLSEAHDWLEAIKNPEKSFKCMLSEEDKDFISSLAPFLAASEKITWETLLSYIKTNFPTKKGKEIFMPLRLALTGKNYGPEMHFIIDEMGTEVIKKRLI